MHAPRRAAVSHCNNLIRRRRPPLSSAASSSPSQQLRSRSFSRVPSPRPQPPSTAAERRTRRIPSAGMRGGAIAVSPPGREFHASPTAPPPPVPHAAPGAVWAQTSTKKDKLNELLTELNSAGVDTAAKGMEALDGAAGAQDKLDLEFADGLRAIAKFVDAGRDDVDPGATPSNDPNGVVAAGDEASLAARNATEQMFRLLESASSSEEWDKPKFEATMHEVVRILSAALPPDPRLKKPVAGSLDASHPFCYMREFVEAPEDGGGGAGDVGVAEEGEAKRQIQMLDDVVARAFSSTAELYRTLILRATAQTLLENWDAITAVTSGDVDRAAVSKIAVPPRRSAVNAEVVRKVFDSHSGGSSEERVRSWWNLIDADGDGLIDEEEMTACVDLATKPVHAALGDMVRMSLEVCPMRTPCLGSDEPNDWFLGGENVSSDAYADGASNPPAAFDADKKLSWGVRRRELKARKAFAKTFQATLGRHFPLQAETPHRLRCIYAWAEKSHQGNKTDSILVDAGGEWGAASSLVGRKRYVELVPKISYPEFREQQLRHYPHLDGVGEEIATSFKEDLWVSQGKGRQNEELKRHSVYFLVGVTLVDVVIGIL